MIKTCFECGSTENIENHHVVPRSKGGKKTIPLCARCHDKVHHRYRSKITSSQLTKEGLKKAKKRGVQLGAYGKHLAAQNKKNAKKFAKELKPTLVKLLKSDTKKSYGAFAKALNRRGIKTPRGYSFAPTTVRNVFLRLGLSF
jgi:formate-dependent nitrite reductase cytochrome c552 subunit